MFNDYSKPSVDISKESQVFSNDDAINLQRQQRLIKYLIKSELRKSCVVCRYELQTSEIFLHRTVEYVLCGNCGHIQTKNEPPHGYPDLQEESVGFEKIYPELTLDEYNSRRNRVYMPKLDWAYSRLLDSGFKEKDLLSFKWLEFGTGAGYFLSALQEKGISNIEGIEVNQHLVKVANRNLGANHVKQNSISLADTIRQSNANIFAAFFVLEHINDAASLFDILKEKNAGTIFIFSVPVFGLSTMLESSFDDYSARNLDSVLHTQIYSDKSIQFGLKSAGYEILSSWIFGQDMIDFNRLLLQKLIKVYPDSLYEDVSKKLSLIIDPLQSVIDKAHLSDARHIIAVKR